MRLMILVFVSAILVPPSSSIGQQPSSPAKQDASAVERAKYVGLKYRELPAGVENRGSGIGIEKSGDYELIEIIRGKLAMLWLERIIDRDTSGKRNMEREVKDLVVLPPMTTRQEFLLGFCFEQPGKHEVAAIVRPYTVGETEFYRPLRGWRANLKTERLEEVAVKSIHCIEMNP